MTLFLVRRGRALVDRSTPASTWPLDPASYDDVWALRERLPRDAAWFTSPDARAVETAQLLTDGPVGVLDDLRGQQRATWVDDHADAVRRAFKRADQPAAPGWETVAAVRERVVAASRPVLAAHAREDVVLVGPATGWVVLLAALTGTEPDPGRWAGMQVPDVIRAELP